MIAYRDLMFTMFWLFAICSIIMFPAMMFYKNQNAINEYNQKSFSGPFSIGSFGYASNQCQITPYNLKMVPINCPYGILGKVVSAGIIPSGSSSEEQYLCNWSNANENTKTKCPVRSNLVAEIQSSLTLGLENNKYKFDSEYDLLSGTPDASCSDSNAKVFVQYECHMSNDKIAEKKSQASIISCLGVFMVLIYLTVLYYFKRASDLSQMKWDIQTITPGDYTAQMEISEKMFSFFKTNIYPREQARKSDISIGESLKSYIKRELERVLTDKLAEMKQLPGNDNIKIKEVKIADIVFAFNNAELINLLKVRGQHIIYQRYDQMREVEK